MVTKIYRYKNSNDTKKRTIKTLSKAMKKLRSGEKNLFLCFRYMFDVLDGESFKKEVGTVIFPLALRKTNEEIQILYNSENVYIPIGGLTTEFGYFINNSEKWVDFLIKNPSERIIHKEILDGIKELINKRVKCFSNVEFNEYTTIEKERNFYNI